MHTSEPSLATVPYSALPAFFPRVGMQQQRILAAWWALVQTSTNWAGSAVRLNHTKLHQSGKVIDRHIGGSWYGQFCQDLNSCRGLCREETYKVRVL